MMDVPGWFGFAATYDRAVAKFADGAEFVEVGAWLGASTIYLARSIKQADRQIKLHVVDTWTGCPTTPNEIVEQHGGSIFPLFLENVRRAGVADMIHPLEMDSLQAACEFADESLDFVFIDATHTYDAVLADLEAWWPKIRYGGVLAGHDYPAWQGVVDAVDDFFGPGNFEPTADGCFWHTKVMPGGGSL